MNGSADSAEEELLRAARSGDQGALTTLYRQYVTPVYRYVRRRVPTAEIAEDIVSETFLAVVEQLNRFRFDAQPRTWIFAIARRRIADHWRACYRLPETAIEPVLALLAVPDDPQDEHSSGETVQDLRPLLARLPKNQRRVLECRFFEGRTIAETARSLDLSEGNVKVIQHRAIAALAKIAQTP